MKKSTKSSWRWGLVLPIAILFILNGRQVNIADFSIPEKPAILNQDIPGLQGRALTADEVARLAMLKSLDIKIAKLGYEAKETDILDVKSQFDINLEANASYEQVREEQPSIVIGDRSITGRADVKITKKTALGLETEIFYQNQRNSTNSSFASLNPNYESHAGITLRQPLLKNAFGVIDRSQVKIVKLDVSQFREETLDLIAQSIFDAREAYWNYLEEAALFEVREKGYQIAKDFLEVTHNQLQTGASEKQDFYAAEANLRRRLQELLRAHLEAKIAMNRLKLLLSDLSDVLPSEELKLSVINASLEDVVTEAMTRRRDYKRKKMNLESKGVELRMNRMKRWPDLDAIGTYGNNSLDRDHKNTQGELFGFNHPTYFLGFELKFPLQNRSARAAARRSNAEKQKAIFELEKLEQQILLEAEDVFKELLITQEIALQARDIEALESQKLEEEMKLFKVGRSSSKTVIDFQDDLLAAQTSKTEAFVAYEKVKDKLLLTQNKLLDSLGLVAKKR